MNILIINHYAGSDIYGMEFRPFYFGRELAKLGHEVTVLAAGYSHLRRRNPEVSVDFTEEKIEGVRYIWLKTPEKMTSWEFFDYLLEQANVVGTPGSGFGPSGEGYFRLTGFGSYENTKAAIERVKRLSL